MRIRKSVFRYLVISLSGLFLSCSNPSSTRPNVLIILVDDLGINDIGRNNPTIETPNIDRLASESIYFENHYADATCSPARAALLTGHRATKVGYMPNGRGISPQWLTIPEFLRDFGYATHHVGKWHLGHYDDHALPKAQGFDTFYGFLSQWLISKPHSTPITESDYSAPSYLNPWIENIKGKQTQVKGHLTSILANQTAALIQKKRNKHKPWFINYWEFAPHSPLQPSIENAALFPNTPGGKYLALLKDLDDAIGIIDTALKSTNQYRNTVVVFLSDNGGTNTQLDNNFPYIGSKTQYLEGGLRTPLMIRWPDKLEPKIDSRQASIIDIHATIQSIVTDKNTKTVPTDGENLLAPQGMGTSTRDFLWATQVDGSVSASLLSGQNFRVTEQEPSITSGKINALFDLNNDPFGSTNIRESNNQLANNTKNLMEKLLINDWQVNTQIVLDKFNLPEIIGDDFQRTPGLNPFTIALSFILEPSENNEQYSVLLHQNQVWSLKIDHKKNRIEANFENFNLSAPIPQANGCQSIIVTLDSYARLNNWNLNKSYTNARLYINGEKADELSSPSAAFVPNTSGNTTKIGNSNRQALFKGKIRQPIMLNVSLPNRWLTPEQIARSACNKAVIYSSD